MKKTTEFFPNVCLHLNVFIFCSQTMSFFNNLSSISFVLQTFSNSNFDLNLVSMFSFRGEEN